MNVSAGRISECVGCKAKLFQSRPFVCITRACRPFSYFTGTFETIGNRRASRFYKVMQRDNTKLLLYQQFFTKREIEAHSGDREKYAIEVTFSFIPICQSIVEIQRFKVCIAFNVA